MEIKNHRGQCTIEVVMVLIVLTTFVLLIQQLANQTKKFFGTAVLSKELR